MMSNEKRKQDVRKNSYYYSMVFAIVLIVLCIFPIRILSLSNWWVNAIFYGIMFFISFVIMLGFMRFRGWRQGIVALILVSSLLTARQTLISFYEVDNCWVEDERNTQLVACTSGNEYQQIGTSAIGMRGYCYYCPWN